MIDRTFALLLAVSAVSPAAMGCSAATEEEALENLGTVSNAKNDAPEIRDRAVTVAKRKSETKPGARNFLVESDSSFRVSLAYEGSQKARIIVTNLDDNSQVASEIVAQPTLDVVVDGSMHGYKIRLENYDAATLRVKMSVLAAEVAPPVSDDLLAAARANLTRISKEIDASHLGYYGLSGAIEDKFLEALRLEYAEQHPDQYEARVRALASMAFFALPDVLPPEGGHQTPFHGLDESQFEALMSIEDTIFNQHMTDNGYNVEGVRPFSVCETTYMIEKFVRPRTNYTDYASYKAGYEAYAATCSERDLNEWYNFRGLGALRPSWVESNLNDRFLRRMAKLCLNPPEAWKSECEEWNADRMGYRLRGTRELAARTMFYDLADESYLKNPSNALVFLEDRNGDGVGEFLRPGNVTLTTGETGRLLVTSIGQFSGKLQFVDSTGATRSIAPSLVTAETSINSAYDTSTLNSRDFGLLNLFSDSTNCTGDVIDQAQCPLLGRFYSLIDRHENFYQTYSAMNPDSAGLTSQPSPLVACSITLRASHHWDTAGTPDGGTAGFIFLMRIPFKEILAGQRKSVSTLSPGPEVTSIQDIYAGTATLDMERAWLDVATLSNNQYSSEHEISAFGAVPASEIEGILVIRKPAAVQ